MTIICTEKLGSPRITRSRDGLQSVAELLLNVQGTSDWLAASNAANAATPPVWGTGTPQFWKQTVTVEVVDNDLWLATVRYDTSGPEPIQANDSFEFDTSGGSERVTQSLATVGSFPSGSPNFQGAIGVSDSGVEGVDILTPKLLFTETHYFAELSQSYRAVLFQLTGTVNVDPFKGFDAGEVLFMGANARRNDNRFATPWVVTYQFAVQLNRFNFLVGSIPVDQKLGWDYMWVRYARSVDVGSNVLVRVPSSVHIEQVYQSGNFGALGIGT